MQAIRSILVVIEPEHAESLALKRAKLILENPGLAAKMFETLAERQINLLAVSSSEIKVSALIAEAELDLAVRVLHTAFGLDSDG